MQMNRRGIFRVIAGAAAALCSPVKAVASLNASTHRSDEGPWELTGAYESCWPEQGRYWSKHTFRHDSDPNRTIRIRFLENKRPPLGESSESGRFGKRFSLLVSSDGSDGWTGAKFLDDSEVAAVLLSLESDLNLPKFRTMIRHTPSAHLFLSPKELDYAFA